MDIKLLLTVFGTVFVAELADKTQLVTLLYAADPAHSKWTVFGGAALALVLACGVGVLAGGFISQHVPAKVLSRIAGAGFILVGLWTLLKS